MNTVNGLKVLVNTFKTFTNVVKSSRRLISSNNKTSDGDSLLSYTSEQQIQILAILHKCAANNITRSHLNEKRLQSIRRVFERNPNLTSLEPLLSVNGLGPKLLHRICNSILQQADVAAPRAVADSDDRASAQDIVKLKSSSSLITPPRISQVGVETAVSIQLGINAISWARLRTDGAAVLDGWDTLDLSHTADKKYDVHTVWELAMELRELVPDGDIYVMENQNWSNVASVKKPLKFHIQESMLSTAICSVFNLLDGGNVPRRESSNRMHFLRTYTAARLFRKMVGSERVSAQDVVQNMMNDMTDVCHRPIIFSGGTTDCYLSRNGSLRDNMSQALLLVVSFVELALLQNPAALAVIGRAGNHRKSSKS